MKERKRLKLNRDKERKFLKKGWDPRNIVLRNRQANKERKIWDKNERRNDGRNIEIKNYQKKKTQLKKERKKESKSLKKERTEG